MTERQRQIIRAYSLSNDSDIFDAYDKPSAKKVKAWRYCQELCERKSGYGLRVIGHNTFTFSAGFLFENPETGVIQLMYITPSYDRAFDFLSD